MVDKIEFELLQSQVEALQKRINYLEFEIKNNYKKKKKKIRDLGKGRITK